MDAAVPGKKPFFLFASRWPVLGAVSLVTLLAVLLGGYVAAQRLHDWRTSQRMQAWQGLAREMAREQNINEAMLLAVIRAESGGNPRALSPAGAMGLMQVRRDAQTDARRILRLPPGEGDLFEPRYNLLIGTTYLRHLYGRFDGDWILTLAAYHMGPTRVARLRRDHPQLSSRELIARYAGPATRAYIQRVMQLAGMEPGTSDK